MIDGHINHSFPQTVLIVGVGRSDTIDTLLKHGFSSIVAIDSSPSLVAKLTSRYEGRPGIDIQVMEVSRMYALQDGDFSLVIDKGCIDCLFCNVDRMRLVRDAYREIYRLLRPNGIFFSVSNGLPLTRMPYMKVVDWQIESFPVHEGESLYLFMGTKSARTSSSSTLAAVPREQMLLTDRPAVSTCQQNMNKSSRIRSKVNTGVLTVTSSLHELKALLEED